jgi:glycosyltransferase involved in cell wall biosynthesis
MKKILHIIVKSQYDGVTSYSIRLIKNLPQYEHHILSCYKGGAISEILGMNITCEHLVHDDRINYRSLLKKYFKSILFFSKNSFDVIHYHQGGVGVLLIAVFLGRKATVLHHLHSGNLIGDNSKEDISFLHSIFLRFLSKYTHQLAVAEHVNNNYKLRIRRTKNLQLIRNAIPYNFREKDVSRNALGYIGRFTNDKGFHLFLSVSEQVKKNQPKLNIIAIGESHIGSDNIKPTTPSFDVEKFYKSIDLLLFTSMAPEGLPLVVLEAISFDVGVVAYPLNGVVEVLGNDYPLYVNSAIEFISKVEYYYSDKFDREKLSIIHKERSNYFNFENMISKINSLYHLLISRK